MKRRLCLLALSISMIAAANRPALAEEPQRIIMACFGGHPQEMFEKLIFPDFEKKHNVKFDYIPGVSVSISAQLAAEKGNPRIDLACMDDGPQSRARSLGLIQPYNPTDLPNLANTYDLAKMPDNIGIGFGFLSAGIVYDEEALKKAGVAPPESWKDLTDPKYKNHLVIPSINTTPGVEMLVMLAISNGGDASKIDPGFELTKKVSENAVGFDTMADPSKYLQSGEAWVGVFTDGETSDFVAQSHYPMRFVYPKDGAPLIIPTVSTVKGAPHQKLADEFLNYLLSEPVQTIVANGFNFGPVNKNVKVAEEIAKQMTYGTEAIKNAVRMDWATINPQRAAWTDRWNREIER